MVLEVLINIFGNIAIFLINLLPEFPQLASFVNKGFQPVFDVLHAINFVVDIQAVGFCLVALFVFSNIEFIFSVVMWIIRKIPGVS